MSENAWNEERLGLLLGMLTPAPRGWVEAAGFEGYSEVEIFSAEHWWKRDGGEVLDTCIARHRSAV